MHQKKWFAIYTRSRWEKKVAIALTKKHIENYCPLNKVTRKWADRIKIVHEPLFSCYVFVFINESEQLQIRQTEGIMNFVFWMGKPAVIKTEEIDAIKSFVEEHHNVRLEKLKVNLHDRVRITDGPLMEREGDVVEVKNKSVKLLLPSLGYTMIAEVEMGRIEIINVSQSSARSNSYKFKDR